jgi:hypothetical protein
MLIYNIVAQQSALGIAASVVHSADALLEFLDDNEDDE